MIYGNYGRAERDFCKSRNLSTDEGEGEIVWRVSLTRSVRPVGAAARCGQRARGNQAGGADRLTYCPGVTATIRYGIAAEGR